MSTKRLFYAVMLLWAVSGCHDAPSTGSAVVDNSADRSSPIDATTDNDDELLEGQATFTGDDSKFALLVGCTTYDHLSEGANLSGPTNDVEMMRDLLVDHFGMSKENVQELSEGVGTPSCRPLKANIAREFKRLAGRVQDGDYVVIYLSGHGSQQPDDDPDNEDDREPDGLDEVFLPADVKPGLSEDDNSIPNAISDDELRKWLAAIREQGASVWVIIDACHSGTATRGSEKLRQIAPNKLLSAKALARVSTATNTRGIGVKQSAPLDGDKETAGIAALYAAQPHEPTLEMPLPDKETGKWRGLLTYTMAKVLLESEEPLTYAELAERIRAEYVTRGRFGPTPLVEGGDQNREVLGVKTWPERSRLVLSKDKKKRLQLNAGKIHGLTDGSILAVYPPAGGPASDEKQPLGYVNVKQAGVVKSLVEPCGFDETEVVADLPVGGRCQLAQLNYKGQRLKVALADSDETSTSAARKQWTAALKAIDGNANSLVEFVDSAEDAHWLVEESDQGGVLLAAQSSDDPPRFGPIPNDESSQEWLQEHLERIARASNLLRVAGVAPAEKKRGLFSALFGKRTLNVSARLLRLKDADDEEGQPVAWSRDGITLAAGDLLALKLTNTGLAQADVTVLFVDSNFGVGVLFPPPNTVADNRIPPNESLMVGPMQVEGDSIGLEHVLIVASKGEGQPLDFRWLAQPSLERARAVGAPTSLATPWGQLLEQTVFEGAKTRGLKMARTNSVLFRTLSWRTVENPPVQTPDAQ